MQTVAVARNAMATRFEIVLHGDDAVSLRAAGDEALAEIDRLESQLSLYRPGSEIARINAHAADGPVRVSPPVFQLLQTAKRLHQETGGLFDISIAPLVRCWGFMGGAGKLPDEQELAAARTTVGMNLVELDSDNFTVRFARPGVMLDLGAIGKGHALERCVELLRDAGVASALLQGGTSTVHALGHPPDASHWKVAVEYPPRQNHDDRAEYQCTVELRDEAMSVSAVWGRSFEANGQVFGHVLDPRSGRPVMGALLSAVVLPSATETDALSTALLVAGVEGHDRIAALRQDMRTLVISRNETGTGIRIDGRGLRKPI
jgi:thiamine biosynthesis lipoprotein